MTTNGNEKRPLPDGWEEATLGQIILPDGVFSDGDWVESKDQDQNGDVRLIQLADVGDGFYRNRSHRFLTYDKALELKCTFLQKGDVLIARMPDPLGRACIFPGDEKKNVTVVDVCIVRTGLGNTNHRWLMHWINTPVFRAEIEKLQSGTTRKRISRKNLTKIKFPVPPTIEQERIVAEIEKQFTRLDQAVASLKRLQSNLARYKASVLKAACEGRLVPQKTGDSGESLDEPAADLLARILAERRAQWEAQERQSLIVKAQKKAAQAQRKTQGLPARIKDLQPGEWESILETDYVRYLPKNDKWKEKYKEPSGVETAVLPELPDGWVWATMDQLADQRLGKMLDKSKNTGNLRPYLRNTNVRWFEFDLSDIKEMRVSDEELDNISVQFGDLVVCEGGEPGRAAVWVRKEPFIIQKALHRVRPANGILPWYLAFKLSSDAQTGKLEKYFTGSTIKHFTGQSLRTYEIPLPPLAEQKRIVAEVERRLSVVTATEQAITANLARAERLRQSILGRAFTGQLV